MREEVIRCDICYHRDCGGMTFVSVPWTGVDLCLASRNGELDICPPCAFRLRSVIGQEVYKIEAEVRLEQQKYAQHNEMGE